MEKNEEFLARIRAEKLGCLFCTMGGDRSYVFNGITFVFTSGPYDCDIQNLESFLRFVRAYEIKEELGLLTDYEKENLPYLKSQTSSLLSLPWLEGITEIRIWGKKHRQESFHKDAEDVSSGWKTWLLDQRTAELEKRMAEATQLWAMCHDNACIQPENWVKGRQTLHDHPPPEEHVAHESDTYYVVAYQCMGEDGYLWLKEDVQEMFRTRRFKDSPPDAEPILYKELDVAMLDVARLRAHPDISDASTWLAFKQNGKLFIIDR